MGNVAAGVEEVQVHFQLVSHQVTVHFSFNKTPLLLLLLLLYLLNLLLLLLLLSLPHLLHIFPTPLCLFLNFFIFLSAVPSSYDFGNILKRFFYERSTSYYCCVAI